MNLEIFLLTIAFIICGLPSFLINTVVFIVIIKKQILRRYHIITAFVILHNGLTGLADIILGITRLIDMNHFSSDQLVDNDYCLLHCSNILVILFLLNGFGLLAYSLDRFLVVRFTILYFKNWKKIIIILLAVIYIIPFFIMVISITIEVILPRRRVSPICFGHLIYAENTFSVILCMRILAAALSIPIMIIVVVIMYRKRQLVIASNQSILFANINGFLERQKEYTITATCSCLMTFFLYIVPAVNQLIHDRLDTFNENEMALYSLLLSNINSYNMVFIFICRQKQIFKEIAKIFIKFNLPKKSTTIMQIFENRIIVKEIIKPINIA
ncbi:putative integral membrane protein [Acanthocheilonema viteae]